MSEMNAAYKLAASGVRRRFLEQRPDYLDALKRLSKSDVAVYTGAYDQAEKTLKVLEIPCLVDPKPADLKAKVVFINCSGAYDRQLIERLGAYVAEGRTLVTSDWALDQVLEQAFPGMVRWNRRSTGDEVVSVEPGLDSLWSEIVVLGANPQWWLWGSHPIEVVDRENVTVEAASHDLLKLYNAPVVAVRFPWGRGQVFHVISHFWAKRSGTPTARHEGSAEEFLRVGMRLTETGIADVLKAGSGPVNFAMLQSAATATELVAQLCARDVAGQ